MTREIRAVARQVRTAVEQLAAAWNTCVHAAAAVDEGDCKSLSGFCFVASDAIERDLRARGYLVMLVGGSYRLHLGRSCDGCLQPDCRSCKRLQSMGHFWVEVLDRSTCTFLVVDVTETQFSGSAPSVRLAPIGSPLARRYRPLYYGPEARQRVFTEAPHPSLLRPRWWVELAAIPEAKAFPGRVCRHGVERVTGSVDTLKHEPVDTSTR